MKKLKNEMIQILKGLRETHGITAIKASFETEDIQLFELLRIVELASATEVGIVVKLGGSEALTDIRLAKMLGAAAILGPMIESKFAHIRPHDRVKIRAGKVSGVVRADVHCR